ncbi:MAG: RNA polymerase sigma factor RpoD/SigA [Ruminococcaceae bacterium]|nr:RNA polymerase sigma factor RpoD/SigA [Oscillospiraceae bacterium]
MTEILTGASAPVSAGEDDVRQYLSEIRQYPLLSPEQERALAKRCAEGDADAIRQMVNANLRLVVSVAKEYAGRGVPLLDLIQEGSIGLLSAAQKFDYTLEFRFSTYATKWIRQGVSKYLLNHADLIRVPPHTAEKIRRIVFMRSKLQQESGAVPTQEELAAACDMTVDKLCQLMRLHPEVCSLDAPLGDDDGAMGSLLADVHAPQPFESLVREELNHTMDILLHMLEDRQREVLQLHFGMVDGVCYSLEEIGQKLGISKERARQIERQAIEKLQKMGASMGLEDFLE